MAKIKRKEKLMLCIQCIMKYLLYINETCNILNIKPYCYFKFLFYNMVGI